MAVQTLDLWTLTRGRPQIDPNDLAEAIAVQAAEEELDYRTRLLIRDGVEALRLHWGTKQLQRWLEQCTQRGRIEAICKEQFNEVGFPSLSRRLMEKTEPELVRQFLRHVGTSMRRDTRVDIAGVIPCIMLGYLSRHTEDVDLIDEVPQELRDNHRLLQELHDNYGLELGHVQSHYYPSGWRDRVHFLGDFGHLQVFLLDVYDVFLSKLFSARIKDMGDLRLLAPQLDKAVLVEKFKNTCGSLLAAPGLPQLATDAWHVLFGEELPQ
ncbi:MAG: DUF6036 family nucleotidyltransferase [Gemmataceae bacterium]|nr:DUF6036 family nucleotidyltransferase [Gemmataceae bacterium]